MERSRRKPRTIQRSRSLRQAGNEAEALLWLDRKARRLGGYRFVRQFPICPYFADFLCRTERLAVEIDGGHHEGSSYDRRRDEFMRQHGFSVLRYWDIDTADVGLRNDTCCAGWPSLQRHDRPRHPFRIRARSFL
ncbi:MAG TPA: DUF559 domain-containing protein [Rhizobiaceae bacterium]|nr:DUF559 domain-containing protein [Rhizobiaceae bacterium]